MKKNYENTTVSTTWLPMFHMRNACVDVGTDSPRNSVLQKALLASNHISTRLACTPMDAMWPFKLSIHFRCGLKYCVIQSSFACWMIHLLISQMNRWWVGEKIGGKEGKKDVSEKII